jgi:hypothetical protein
MPLLALVLVIFLAGCVGQSKGTSGTSNGVIIKDFSPDFAEVAPGEPVVLSLTIQNVGDADATNTEADLFTLNPTEWGTLNPLIIGTLTKAVPADKVPGGDYSGEWNFPVAPSINVPSKIYTATARVKYDYVTNASATVRFITNDYLRSLQPSEQDKARKASGLISQVSSNAPIKISFSASSRPFVVPPNGGSFSFQIILTNAGQGNPYNSEPIGTSSLYKMDITTNNVISTNVNLNCPSLTTAGTSGYEVRLPKGESKTISCTISAGSATIDNVLEGSINVMVTYKYFVDADTKFTITQQT